MPSDLAAGFIEVEKKIPFVEQKCFGAVQIFRFMVTSVVCWGSLQNSAGKSDRLSFSVPQRENDPGREPIEKFVLSLSVREDATFLKESFIECLRFQHLKECRPIGRRKTYLILFQCLRGEAALNHVIQRSLPRNGIHEDLMVKSRRFLMDLDQFFFL